MLINNCMADSISNYNYLTPTGFRVVIDRKNYANLTYFAQSIQHPSMELNPVEAPFKRLNVSFVGDKIQHNPLSIIFLMDEDMAAYSEIYDWMERSVEEPQVNSSPINQAGDKTSFADITVTILTSQNNKNKEIRYKNCHPISLGDVEFTAVSDGQYLTFPGTFRFDYYELI